MIDRKDTESSVRQFNISRVHFEPGYSIDLDNGSRKFYVEMDFDFCSHKLTLYDLTEASVEIAESRMPWFSSELYVCFNGHDQIQGIYCEKMAKTKSLPRKDLVEDLVEKERYVWTTHEADEGIGEGLSWTVGRRNFTLRDLQSDTVLAIFYGNEDLYTGGSLKLSGSWEQRCGNFDVKILMTFLALYDRMRKRAHHTLYKTLKGKGISSRIKAPIVASSIF